MENIPVTTYRGFSAVSGETTFTQDMADIRNGKHAKLIIKIASLVAQGKVEEANHVKKQLPFRTLTANYRERRLAPSITRYNPVITLDIDDLEEGQLEQTRTLINEDPHTQLVLVQALEKYGFGTRTNEQETTEYEVVDIQTYQ